MTSTVLVALRVAATPERTFLAFTEEIGTWWRPWPLFQLTPRGDGLLRFEPGPQGRLLADLPNGNMHEVGRVRVWAPPRRLVVGWRPAGVPPERASELEVRFEPIGAQTRVTVEHRGWDAVPPESAARHRLPDAILLARAGDWWRNELAAFARCVAGG